MVERLRGEEAKRREMEQKRANRPRTVKRRAKYQDRAGAAAGATLQERQQGVFKKAQRKMIARELRMGKITQAEAARMLEGQAVNPQDPWGSGQQQPEGAVPQDQQQGLQRILAAARAGSPEARKILLEQGMIWQL
jgi:hypothetical protein